MKYGFFALVLVLLLAGCESSPPQALVIYSGRSQALVEPLVERFKAQTGLPVEVRFGRDAELLAALQEEGAQSPADLFWANTTGALGAASNADLLVALPDSILQKPASFQPSSGLWAPATVRFRVLAYNTEALTGDDLPASVLDLPKREDLRGRIGWTPTYSSFQDFVTALRLLEGEEAARAWLEGMLALEPKAYPSNTPMIQALAAGEIDVALTNHYYVLRLTQGAAEGEAPPVALYHFAPGDVGNLALVTGAGVLATSDNTEAALRFLSFLLSEQAQAFAATEVYEYPVVSGVAVPSYLLSMPEALALSPQFDFERLRELDATLNLMRDVGLL